MRKYCSCGGVTEYSFDAPKFCSKCGRSFSSSVASVPKLVSPPVVVQQPRVVAYDENGDEDETIGRPIPKITKAAVDISFEKAKPERLGDLQFSDKMGNNRTPGKKLKKGEFAKVWKQESEFKRIDIG